MHIEFYRSQYDFEFDQRTHLGSSVNIPVTAATFLFGGLAALSMRFDFTCELSTFFFSAAAVGASISLVMTIYFIFRSLLGYEYEKLPAPSALRSHHQSLIDWHLQHNSTREAAEVDFQEYLSSKLSQAAERNSENNINRGSYIYMATFSIAVSVVLILIAASVFLYENVDSGNSPQKVEIIGSVQVEKGD